MRTRSQQLPARSLVICGPSGSGKSTLLKRLLQDHGHLFAFTVSHTSRAPRKGELNGREYHFTSREEMLRMIQLGEFIEYTQFSGNLYGTSKRAVREALREGKSLVLEVDIEGVKALAGIRELEAVFVFVKPPSKQLLVERLLARGSESVEALKLRLERADQELAFADAGPVPFDLVLVNDNLDETCKSLERFLSL